MRQGNLSITTTYTIVGSNYVGLENGTCCDNCGRLISNLAFIENADGKEFTVGMDCAGTLAGIKDDFTFEYVHKANFQQAKQARATILRNIKKGLTNLRIKTSDDTNNYYKEVGAGVWYMDYPTGGSTWKQYPRDVWKNYVLPMIKDLKA